MTEEHTEEQICNAEREKQKLCRDRIPHKVLQRASGKKRQPKSHASERCRNCVEDQHDPQKSPLFFERKQRHQQAHRNFERAPLQEPPCAEQRCSRIKCPQKRTCRDPNPGYMDCAKSCAAEQQQIIDQKIHKEQSIYVNDPHGVSLFPALDYTRPVRRKRSNLLSCAVLFCNRLPGVHLPRPPAYTGLERYKEPIAMRSREPNDLQEFLKSPEAARLQNRKNELTKLTDSEDGRTVKAMLDKKGAVLQEALQSGNMTELQKTVNELLQTEAGARLAAQLNEVLNHRPSGEK